MFKIFKLPFRGAFFRQILLFSPFGIIIYVCFKLKILYSPFTLFPNKLSESDTTANIDPMAPSHDV